MFVGVIMDDKEKILDFWNNLFIKYEKDEIVYDDWLDMFNDIIMNTNKPILDLGCGRGNNLKYLLEKNKKVIACDLSPVAIDDIKKNFPNVYDTKCFDMLDGLPFEDETFDVIIADLSLHYFKKKDTEYVISELKRVLCNDGYLLIRLNSVNDYNSGYGKGIEVEKHLYQVNDNELKRYFDEEDIREFFKNYVIVYLKKEYMNRYDLEKSPYRVCLKKEK
jgi:SAM-dependent methyltransferase